MRSKYDSPLPLSPLAVVSSVAGAFGFLGLPVLASFIAIWAGCVARKPTRSVPPTARGDKMAGAGILMDLIQIWTVAIALFIWLLYLGYTSLFSL